jgi:hypothetical protein
LARRNTNHKYSCFIAISIILHCIMMKSLALAAIVWTIRISTVVSEIVPFVTLNGGVTTTTKFCNKVEWDFVMGELYKAFKPVRRLGGQMEQSDAGEQPTSRDLQLFKCDGKYSSWKPGCGGRASRRLQGSATVCKADIARFNKVLDGLLSSMNLSSACKAYIGPTPTRAYSCREILECNIKWFALWNADTDKLETAVLPSNGTKICSTFKPNFEAATNFHVGDVSYLLANNKGDIYMRREWDTPYFAFGNTGYTNIYAKQLDVGNYTLTAVAIAAPTKSLTIQFEIVPYPCVGVI